MISNTVKRGTFGGVTRMLGKFLRFIQSKYCVPQYNNPLNKFNGF